MTPPPLPRTLFPPVANQVAMEEASRAVAALEASRRRDEAEMNVHALTLPQSVYHSNAGATLHRPRAPPGKAATLAAADPSGPPDASRDSFPARLHPIGGIEETPPEIDDFDGEPPLEVPSPPVAAGARASGEQAPSAGNDDDGRRALGGGDGSEAKDSIRATAAEATAPPSEDDPTALAAVNKGNRRRSSRKKQAPLRLRTAGEAGDVKDEPLEPEPNTAAERLPTTALAPEEAGTKHEERPGRRARPPRINDVRVSPNGIIQRWNGKAWYRKCVADGCFKTPSYGVGAQDGMAGCCSRGERAE